MKHTLIIEVNEDTDMEFELHKDLVSRLMDKNIIKVDQSDSEETVYSLYETKEYSKGDVEDILVAVMGVEEKG